MLDRLRSGLRSPEPLSLLDWMSAIVEAGEPYALPMPGQAPTAVTLDELVASFEGTPCAETTAALRVINEFTRDDALRTRIAATLAGRPHHLPLWLSHLDEARISGDVHFLTESLGDGDDFIFGVRLAGGEEITVVVFVDHNLGGALKDAFVAPEPLRDAIIKFVDILEPGQTLTVTDAATARAVIEEAQQLGASFLPPLQSDTWPMSRPLVEWATSLLPAGGTAPARKGWTRADVAAITADFFASSEGRTLDTADNREILDLLLDFRVNHRGDDPLRWSAAVLEDVLTWIPGHLLVDTGFLDPIPDLLETWVPYAHRVRGVDPAQSAQVMVALAALSADFFDALDDLDSGGPQTSTDALLRTLGLDSIEELARIDPAMARRVAEIAGSAGDFSPGAYLLNRLAVAVGGTEELAALDTTPLPDEPFDWTGVPEDIRPMVTTWLDLADRCADELFDVEHRTVFRRFLARAAAVDPAVFRRVKASPVRGAAALVWVATKANQTVGLYKPLNVKDLFAWFGFTGSVSQRAEPLLKAVGVNPHHPWDGLGSPDLLVALRRAEIIADRDRWTADPPSPV
ncbi:hypothetical protein SAMN05216410_0299 [Sanguibacter gelidistatuariae]|uniref:Uncharacterized protein n=2 Tax=Sanguibacter gelidistatuariae TaxID=1814289 RepID=A0A1G6GMP4_9MICO|nr:hypothetical protein SAMN05216410_0299 [Sanguibacter gelidistatuariae]